MYTNKISKQKYCQCTVVKYCSSIIWITLSNYVNNIACELVIYQSVIVLTSYTINFLHHGYLKLKEYPKTIFKTYRVLFPLVFLVLDAFIPLSDVMSVMWVVWRCAASRSCCPHLLQYKQTSSARLERREPLLQMHAIPSKSRLLLSYPSSVLMTHSISVICAGVLFIRQQQVSTTSEEQ